MLVGFNAWGLGGGSGLPYTGGQTGQSSGPFRPDPLGFYDTMDGLGGLLPQPKECSRLVRKLRQGKMHEGFITLVYLYIFLGLLEEKTTDVLGSSTKSLCIHFVLHGAVNWSPKTSHRWVYLNYGLCPGRA